MLMLFINLTGGPFPQGQFFKFAEFWVFRTYIGFSNCEYGCLLNKSSLCCYQIWPNEAEGLGRLSDSPVKDVVSFWHTAVSRSSAERSAPVCINYVTKLSLSEKGISVCRNRKQFQIGSDESVWFIYEQTV